MSEAQLTQLRSLEGSTRSGQRLRDTKTGTKIFDLYVGCKLLTAFLAS